jgi:predicted nucleic acid-binding Zn ribbon protein
MTAPEPTGYCLCCGAYLRPAELWCGPKCAMEWTAQGAAYATVTSEGISVEETDADGRTTRQWIARYY